MAFSITNRVSGHCFGVYPGETPEQALDALAVDAGYADHAEAVRETAGDPDELVAEASAPVILAPSA